VATQVAVAEASNGIHYAMWGETRISDADLERLVQHGFTLLEKAAREIRLP